MLKPLSDSIPPKIRKPKRMDSPILPWLFMLPSLLLISFVVAGPLLGTISLSFTDWDGISSPKFIGFQNFSKLITDPTIYKAFYNNLKWLIYFCTVPIAFAFFIAYLLTKAKRSQIIYRTIFLAPYICSTVVTAMIWKWIYDPFSGINSLLEKLGFHDLPVWLGDIKIALFSVALTDSWRYWGFLMVLFLSALSQTDKGLEEAAKIDGAKNSQVLFHIIIPQLRGTIILVLMLTMIWSFSAFDYVYVMTGGGPGNATELIATYMYTMLIKGQAAGYASAIALVLLLLTGLVIFGFGLLKKKGWDI